MTFVRDMNRLWSTDFFKPSSGVRAFKQSVDGEYQLHCHDFFEVAYIMSGEGTHILNGRSLPMKEGTVFIITPADFHSLLADEAAGELMVYNVIFSEKVIVESIYQTLFLGGVEHHYQTSDDRLKELFEALWEESESSEFGAEICARGLLEMILVRLSRMFASKLDPADKALLLQPDDRSSHAALRKAMMHIQHHFRKPLRLEDAAEQAAMSPNYFSECFHRKFGVSFQRYLVDLRLNFARLLLANSTLSITEVCMEAGFNTLSHFERMFKARYNTTPKAYKKQVTEGEAGS